MRTKRPLFALSSIPFLANFTVKLALGSFLATFILGLEPTIGVPVVRNSLVHAAEPEQTPQVNAGEVLHSFQLPFSGYLSTRFSNYHPGVDIATGIGMPIKPIAKGTVVSAGYTFAGYGLNVIIDHGDGYQSLYAHLGRTYVKSGQVVEESDYIGEVGMTGNTTGPHTHLEVSLDGRTIDPLTVLPSIRTVPEGSDFIAYGGQNNRPEVVEVTPTFTPTATPIPSPTPELAIKPQMEIITESTITPTLTKYLPEEKTLLIKPKSTTLKSVLSLR